MAKLIANAIRRGVLAVRSVVSGQPSDALAFKGDSLQFKSKGTAGRLQMSDLRNVSLSTTFLGVFGSTLTLSCLDGTQITIQGLDPTFARSTKEMATKAIQRIAAEAADRKLLAKSKAKIVEAYEALQSDCYLSARQMELWRERFSSLSFICGFTPTALAASSGGDIAWECREALVDSEAWRRGRNDRWVEHELVRREALFTSLAATPLTVSQQHAIVRHDNRVLAVAGAGTGKTTTVVAKIAYLLKTEACRPDEILVLSYSKNSVEELKTRIERVCEPGVEARTFHSLGLEIITKATGVKPATHDAGIETTTVLLGEMLKEPAWRAVIHEYLSYYYYPPPTPAVAGDKKALNRFINAHDIRTWRGERVRSLQEAHIANWLFLNGIRYDYEVKFQEAPTGSTEKRVYRPDFFLPDYGIYIEHYGVSRAGNTRPGINKEDYNASIQWKRDLHGKHGTLIVETFSFDFKEGQLERRLKDALEYHGVKLKPVSVDCIESAKEFQVRARVLAKLLNTVISLFKEDRLRLKDLEARFPESVQMPRETRFFDLFREALRRHEKMLERSGAVDFADMISSAAAHVMSGAFQSPYRVVIVDEFQDVSRGRAWLINALLERCDDSRLLCVGDDWQSIYRFCGSDVSLMTDFQTTWPEAVRVDLDQSFRLNNKLQLLTSHFITRNPSQLKKTIACERERSDPAVTVTARRAADVVRDLRARHPDSSVLVLGRYNFLVDEFVAGNRPRGDERTRAMTVHKAKGLEADYVVVDRVAAGRNGFPTEVIDDPLIGLFLAGKDNYPNAEERRLFYVALSRARHEVWLCADTSHTSTFIDELISTEYASLVTVEPDVIVGQFSCPMCDGPVAKRVNRSTNEPFLGCQGYPRCRGTIGGCPKCRGAIPVRAAEGLRCPRGECGWTGQLCPRCHSGFVTYRSDGKIAMRCSRSGQCR
jgi:DNA helicase-4